MRKFESFGPTSQKILLLLMAGASLSLTRSPSGYFKVLKEISKEWNKINNRALHSAIKNLYKSKLIDAKDNHDGSTILILTSRGKSKALTYKIDEIKIQPTKRWDNKWRVVLFDIPESRKRARDALSLKLKQAGFYKLQKSVFVSPFECSKEIDFIIEFFSLRPYVRIIIANHIDNEFHLKRIFGI
ncbi:MAG: CRISPR-associated endonuclease Cas2 [bacterium]|nr:CRISPR-associated endonuclease Cas2 [bacterium]